MGYGERVAAPPGYSAEPEPSSSASLGPSGEYPSRGQINAARTPKGGWTKAQLAEWGVPWPPPKGWKQALAEGVRE